MKSKGQVLGYDLDDAVYIPVANAMRMFNLDEVMEVDVAYQSATMVDRVVGAVRQILIDRHRGTEDFSITTQAVMLESLDEIIRIVTLAAAGIAGISLVAGALGIVTMMWISVRERVSEIGLLRAMGGPAPTKISNFYRRVRDPVCAGWASRNLLGNVRSLCLNADSSRLPPLC